MFIAMYLVFSPKQKDEKCGRESYSHNLFESFITKNWQGKNKVYKDTQKYETVLKVCMVANYTMLKL